MLNSRIRVRVRLVSNPRDDRRQRRRRESTLILRENIVVSHQRWSDLSIPETRYHWSTGNCQRKGYDQRIYSVDVREWQRCAGTGSTCHMTLPTAAGKQVYPFRGPLETAEG